MTKTWPYERERHRWAGSGIGTQKEYYESDPVANKLNAGFYSKKPKDWEPDFLKETHDKDNAQGINEMASSSLIREISAGVIISTVIVSLTPLLLGTSAIVLGIVFRVVI